MKNFSFYLNNGKFEEIETKEVSVSWEYNLKYIFELGKEELLKLIDNLKENISNEIKNIYNSNPHKSNVKLIGNITVGTNIGEPSNDLEKLIQLYDEIGMHGAIDWFNNDFIINTITGVAKSKRSNIIYTENSRQQYPKTGKIPGNGYNDLPGDLISLYKDKLLKLIYKTKITIIHNKERRLYQVIINPLFKDNDIKKLYHDMNSDVQLTRYKNLLNSTNKELFKEYNR